AKKVRTHAWICLPDNPYPAAPAQPRDRRTATIAGVALGAVLIALAVVTRILLPDQRPNSPEAIPTTTTTTTTITKTITVTPATTGPDLGMEPTEGHPVDPADEPVGSNRGGG